MRILQHATKPSTNLVCGCALSCVGKFPLKEFYEEGHQALTQVDWVRYFIEVSNKGGAHRPGLQMLSKVCQKFLDNQLKKTKGPEFLPNDLARGSRDFYEKTELPDNSVALCRPVKQGPSAIEDVPQEDVSNWNVLPAAGSSSSGVWAPEDLI